MIVVCDSGGCCAIKIIRNFETRPDYGVYLDHSRGHDEDQYSTTPEMEENWARVPERVYKKGAEAFAYYVDQIKERRPAGMIVVNLAEEPPCDCDCGDCEMNECPVENWRPVFEKHGFQERSFLNSNSGSTIHQFTLVYGDN